MLLVLTLFFLLAFTIKVSSQVYPVTTMVNLTPPYPSSLDGYTDMASGKITLHIMVNDLTLSNYPVKLRLIMKSNSVVITTSSSYNTSPLLLNGGETIVLTSADLAGYFRPENLDFSGFSKNQYLKTGQLPDGVYQITFEVMDYQRSYVISSSRMPAFAYIYVNDPPILNMPFDRAQIAVTGQQNIIFNWTFRHSPFSRPGFIPEYKLELWEVYPDNLDPYAVAQATPPVYTKTLNSTTFSYTVMEPLLIPGRKYAWRVTVTDPNGITAFKEGGKSALRWFQYGTACDAPVIKTGTVGPTYINVEWETKQYQSAFRINYKPVNANGGEWYSGTTSLQSYRIDNLKPNTEYYVEVTGTCGTQESPVSERLRLRTKQDLAFECGKSGTLPDITNRKPLMQLRRGDYIKAGEFEVEVYEAQGANGTFNGKGFVLVPLFNFIKLEADLVNIQVNTDYQMIGGSIKTVYNLSNSLIFNLDDMFRGSDMKKENNSFIDIADIKINAHDSIQSVIISGNSVVVNTTREKITEAVSEDKLVVITAPSGKQYVVDAATNTVYTQSTPSGTAPSKGVDALKRASENEKKFTVSFNASDQQMYGFDKPDELNVPPDNYKTRIYGSQSVYIPWKSVETGRFDRLDATINGYPADSVFFSRHSKSMVMVSKGTDDSKRSLLITGSNNDDEDELYAWYTYDGNEQDTNKNIYYAGSVNIVSYEPISADLCIVSVNGSKVPADKAAVEAYLNKVYAPAIVKWKVTYLEGGLSVTLENGSGKKIDNTDPDSRMDYTADMKQVNAAMKDHPAYNRHAVYLFFFDQGTDEKEAGYMPLGRQFGYIIGYKAAGETAFYRTIAHELGHGIFNLRHTFSNKNFVSLSEGTTDNLMDYTSGTALYKYQWDEIHDPQKIWFSWLQEEEEGQAKTSVVEFLPLIGHNSSSFSTKELKDIKKFATTEDNCTPLDAEKDWLVFVGKKGTFLAKAPKGTTLDYEIECGTIKSHTNLTEKFAQHKDNKDIYDKMLRKYPEECADKNNCELVTVELNNEVGKILSKKPKGESIIVSNTLLDNLFLDKISVYGFAPSVADTKLYIKYDILHPNSLDNKLKVQVIQQESEKLMFEDEITITDENKAGTYVWDGTMNHGEFLNQKITSGHSRFIVRITYNNESKEQRDLFIDSDLEEWAGCKNERLKNLVLGGFEGYKKYKKMYESDGLKGNVIDYFDKNIKEYTFLSQKVFVHQKFWTDVLKPIDDKLKDEITLEPIYNYFSMRPINGSPANMSPHAYGCALDFKPMSNPQIFYNCDRPIFYLIKKSTGVNFDKNAPDPTLAEHEQANNRFVELFTSATPDGLYNKYKSIDLYFNGEQHYSFENLYPEVESDIVLLHSSYNTFLQSLNEGESSDVLVSNKQAVLAVISSIETKLLGLNNILGDYINTVVFNQTNISTLNTLQSSYVQQIENIVSTYKTEMSKTGTNSMVVEISPLAELTNMSAPTLPNQVPLTSLLSEISSFTSGLTEAIDYFYTYTDYNTCSGEKVSSENKDLLIADLKIKAEEFDNYKLAAFGFALKERIVNGQFTKGKSTTILQRGFFNIPDKLIEVFKEVETLAETANFGLDILEWGGEYNSKKDWMHIGIRKEECYEFINNKLKSW
jgi:5-hydroxyisourate hydrolase-like protein (transthyretin family)